MPDRIILASASRTRADLLERAGVPFDLQAARIDEPALRDAMRVEGASPRDIADALAEMKATRISEKSPGRWVLGCDQVLALGDAVFAKPETVQEANSQLERLSGQTHQLLSAMVICEDGQPIWRHVGVARMTMRDLSPDYIAAYAERNWDSIRHSPGAYRIEEEGVRLFSRIDGDYFTILGLPLVELLSFLTLREKLPT